MPARRIQRRTILRASAAAGVLAGTDCLRHMLSAQDAPVAIKRDGARPAALQGVASGDVGHDRVMVWSRCDRPAQMVVEWSISDRFTDLNRVPGPAAIEATDFTAKLDLGGLPPGERIFYRVLFQDLRDLKNWSEPVVGTFVTPPAPGGKPPGPAQLIRSPTSIRFPSGSANTKALCP